MFTLIRRFVSPIKYIKRQFTKCVIYSTIIALYTVVSVEVFNVVLHAVETKNIEATYSLLGIYVIISIIFILFRQTPFATHNGWGPIIYDGAKSLSNIYLGKFVEGDGNYTEKIGTGKFISIIETGIYTWLDLIHKFAWFFWTNMIIVIYGLIKICLINIHLGLLGIVLVVGGFFLSTLANIKMRSARLARWEAKNEITRGFVKILMSKNELLQNNGVENEIQKLYPHMEKAKISQYIVAVWFNVLEDIPRFIFIILRCILYIYFLQKMISETTTMTEVGIFILVITYMEKSVDSMLHISREILKDFFQVQKLWDTFDQLPKIQGYDEGKVFIPKQKNIHIQNITYKYDNIPVFEDFSLEIEHGKKTALVGMSGAGKTTLIKLIAGYLHPESGHIEIQGQNLSTIALKTYYQHIGYLTQEPGVFDGTIEENLRASSVQELTEKHLYDALNLANCEFIYGFKDGIKTEIGERGIRLSGGQKQRLAIAKVFLKNPSIILLDEPTSALDSFSEEKITQALEKLFAGRTVVIVAHRLQTVKKADDIIVIENGIIQERGTHKTLMKKGGIYTSMIELQSGF